MKKYRHLIQGVLLFIIIGVSSLGCMTKALWRDNDVNIYDETIIAFYASKNVDEIIFIGKKFHYIFSIGTRELQEVLEAREFLGLNQKNLSITTVIDRKNLSSFHSGIGIEFKEEEITPQQRSWLKLHGFNVEKLGNARQGYRILLVNHFSLKGIRYKADDKINSRVVKLDYPINLEITEPVNNKVYKVLATPVALVTDAGLLVLKAIFYYPIIWTMKPSREK